MPKLIDYTDKSASGLDSERRKQGSRNNNGDWGPNDDDKSGDLDDQGLNNYTDDISGGGMGAGGATDENVSAFRSNNSYNKMKSVVSSKNRAQIKLQGTPTRNGDIESDDDNKDDG